MALNFEDIVGHPALRVCIQAQTRAMQQASQINEPDYGHLLDYMMVADGGRSPRV